MGKGLDEQSPGIGGAQTSIFHVKGHSRNQTSEDTKRRRGPRGRRGGSTGDGAKKNKAPQHGTGRGLGQWSRPAGGAGSGVRLVEAGRGREGHLDGRVLGPTGTWAQVEGGKKRKPDG